MAFGLVCARTLILLLVATTAPLFVSMWNEETADTCVTFWGDDRTNHYGFEALSLLLFPLIFILLLWLLIKSFEDAAAIVLLKMDGETTMPEGAGNLLRVDDDGEGTEHHIVEFCYEYQGKKYATSHSFAQGPCRKNRNVLEAIPRRFHPRYPQLCKPEEYVSITRLLLDCALFYIGTFWTSFFLNGLWFPTIGCLHPLWHQALLVVAQVLIGWAFLKFHYRESTPTSWFTKIETMALVYQILWGFSIEVIESRHPTETTPIILSNGEMHPIQA